MKIGTLILMLCALVNNLSAASNMISLSGSPGTFVINSATAGSNPNSASNASTSYSITTDTSTHRIAAKLNSNMPSGLTLRLRANAPPGGSSQGNVTMSTTERNLVTNITNISSVQTATLTYTLSATVNAATVTNGTRTVTITLY